MIRAALGAEEPLYMSSCFAASTSINVSAMQLSCFLSRYSHRHMAANGDGPAVVMFVVVSYFDVECIVILGEQGGRVGCTT